MSSQETVRQHYVPKTYLNKFGVVRKENEYFVYATPKQNLEKVISVNTKKICVKNNLYTLNGASEAERQWIEKFYDKEIEAKYNEVYNILTSDTVKEVSTEQKELIISVAVTLLFRVTKWLTDHNNLIERTFEKGIQFAQQLGKNYFIFNGIKISFKGKTPKRLIEEYKLMQKEYQVLTQLDVALKLINLRKSDAITVIKIENDDYSFVTSDNPVYLYNMNSRIIAPFDPTNQISLPLNSKYKLTLNPADEITAPMPNYIARIFHFDHLSMNEVIINNYKQYQNAENFIIGDKKTIKEFKSFKKKYSK